MLLILSYLAYKENETPLLTASREMEEKESEQNWAPSSIASSSSSYFKVIENVATAVGKKNPEPVSIFPSKKPEPTARICSKNPGLFQKLHVI